MIGVFDSGFGGLTIYNELKKSFPEHSFLYFADSKNAPYGEKKKQEIYTLTQNALDKLFSKGCEIVIIACNTVSSDVLSKIQNEYLPRKYPNKRVLGVIAPIIEKIIESKEHTNSLIIATKYTTESDKYNKELNKYDIFPRNKECSRLVSLIEGGEILKIPEEVENCLRPELFRSIDSLILACTHFSIIRKLFNEYSDVYKFKIYDPVDFISLSLGEYLKKHSEIKLHKKEKNIIYSSLNPEVFIKKYQLLFGLKPNEQVLFLK